MMGTEDFDIVASHAKAPLFYDAPAPPSMTPKQFQLAGVEYCLTRRNAIFGDAPGLGKTIQGILLSNAIGAKSTLVVCPASLRLNWEREIWKWSTLPDVSTYPVLKAKDGVSFVANYVILSYDLVSNPGIFKALMSKLWDHLILDEAHYLKATKGNRRTQYICAPDGLQSKCGRITLATGTLMPNQPSECLGPETLILTNRGWRAIIHVLPTDLLWDGVGWVSHEGVICQGIKETIQIAGVDMTSNHALLSGTSWVSAEELASKNDILSRALATGLEHLPLWGTSEAQEAGWKKFGSNVIAESPLTQWEILNCGEGDLSADLARPYGQTKSAAPDTLTFAPMLGYENGNYSAFINVSNDAITQSISHIITMGRGGYVCFPVGAKGERGDWSSLNISQHWQVGMIKNCKWTASTTREDMSRAICDLSPPEKIAVIDDLFERCRQRSMSSKNVYDIVNAGPRHRFMILSNQGPLISHNCYNAIRLTNWEAINKASLNTFMDTYYDKGGGMVRGPVFDPKTETWSNKLHWSEEVRNQPKNLEDLQYRLRKYVMVRRRKEEVLSELPPKQWHVFPIERTSAINKAMSHEGWARAEKLYQLDPEHFKENASIDGAVSTARRLLGEAKAKPVADYIDDLLHSGVRKIIVAAWHHSVLTILWERLNKFGLVYMDGSTSQKNRQAAVDQFQNDERVRIILGQMQSLGEGWTLTEAQDAVLAEVDWVPGKNDQLLDRAHRMGQEGSYVLGHVPVVSGSMDERILSRVIKKDKNIHKALDAQLLV